VASLLLILFYLFYLNNDAKKKSFVLANRNFIRNYFDEI
jgi:hypothetical protein